MGLFMKLINSMSYEFLKNFLGKKIIFHFISFTKIDLYDKNKKFKYFNRKEV